MSNIEKKLDALIDALGFDVEETVTHNEYTNTLKGNLFCPDIAYTGLDEIIDYKLTKRNSEQAQQEVIVDTAKELLKQTRIYDLPVSEIIYKGVTVKYRKDKESIEVILNEKI